MINALSRHSRYRCRHSGACCTSNWPIHVEADRARALRRALGEGRLTAVSPDGPAQPLAMTPDLPPGAAAVLATTPSGACVFYDGVERRCAVQRTLGHESLPSACQHFPRRCLIERDAVFVSLSHYCPTVARMTLDDESSHGVVEAPASLVGHLRPEGLDARDVLPPLLRPGMLTDLDGYHAWEREVVALLESGETPEVALARVRWMTRAVQSWSPGDGTLSDTVGAAAAECRRIAGAVEDPGHLDHAARLDLFEQVRMAVPEAHRPAAIVPVAPLDDVRLVAAAWNRRSRPLGRFLAAHAFGNWSAYLGSGIGTVVRSLDAALAVVRVEAARLCAKRQQVLDDGVLVEAFRSADLLLVHLADPQELAKRLDTAYP
jgi:Fe-S-cluster containining protein